MTQDADAIVIGGGHNGLTAAWYLADAGLSVIVLERREIVGGAAVTEELFDGYRLGTCAYLCHVLQRRVIDDMALRDHGLHIYPLDPSALFVFPDGRSFRMWHDHERTAGEIGQMPGTTAADTDGYLRWTRFWEQAAGILNRYFLKPAPTIGRIRADLAGSPDAGVFETLLTASVRDLADDHFNDPGVAAAAVGTADYGALGEPGTALSQAYFKLSLLQAGEDFGIVRGGMGGITQAMAAAATATGVEIKTGALVERINASENGVTSVTLAGGETLSAPVILSNADPKSTFLCLAASVPVPADYRTTIASLTTRSASLKFHAVLDGLPDFSAYLRDDDDETRLAMVRMMPALDHIEMSWNDAMAGRPTRYPLMQVQIPSVLDPTLAPAGHHVMSVWVTYQPVTPSRGSWAAIKPDVEEQVIAELERYAPDIRDRIVQQDLFTPDDISERMAMTDGNIRHLDMSPGQLLSGRLDYRTPVRGLYLCGSGTHPGGEVTGAPGHNAAHAVLADMGR
ncbi:MAG: NAD(P)/FAD-dependent oxidoreductase [Chloroflexi bacterium]|nr:NAD(P)/FAD-dependent oxidoreductase [Chloroflexota bacterium]